MKLMEDNDVPIDTYIHSILVVDIYGKRGDYKSADGVISEMRLEGIEPTLPAVRSQNTPPTAKTFSLLAYHACV